MRLHHHTAISLTISVLLYMIFRSWGLAISSLIAGILIDLDHFFDYINDHSHPYSVKHFFHICNNCQFDKIVLILHGWEWVALMGIAAWLTGWNPWITGTFIGIGQHIFLDAFYNGSGFKSYSLFWRWKKNFKFDTIFHGLKKSKYEYRNKLKTDPNTD